MSDDTFFLSANSCLWSQRVGDCSTVCVMVTVCKGFMWSMQSTIRREGTESDGCSLERELRLHIEMSMCWRNIACAFVWSLDMLGWQPLCWLCACISSVCQRIAQGKGSVCWRLAPDKVKCMPTHCSRQRKCMPMHCSRQSEAYAEALLQTKWSVCWRIASDKVKCIALDKRVQQKKDLSAVLGFVLLCWLYYCSIWGFHVIRAANFRLFFFSFLFF